MIAVLRQPLTWVALLAAAAVAFAAVVVTRGDEVVPVAAAQGDPHARSTMSGAERTRALNAIETVSASTSQAELVAKGRQLFRSNALAKSGESCQGCHTDGGANADIGTTPHPQGPSDFTGPRDPPSLYGVANTAPYFWNGDVATLNEVSLATIANHFADGTDGTVDAANMSVAEAAAALTAYMKTFEAPEGDFSQGTLSDAARRGQVLFQGKANCVACHIGPEFTDNRVHDIFVPQVVMPGGANATDFGAKKPPTVASPPAVPFPTTGVCPKPAYVLPEPPPELVPPGDPLWCAFNTPTLLGVGRTGPYMHNGTFATLGAVVQFYTTSSIVAPLGLTVEEQADLVKFLEAL